MSLFRRRAAAPAPAAAGAPVLVLVADDDPVVREVLQAALESRGWSVLAVADGRSAVEAAQRHRPQVAVLDWLMPGLYGPDVCAALRADPTTCDIPLLLLTTQGEERDVSHAYRAGADEYLTKPFHPREVLGVVERLLSEPPARPEAASRPAASGPSAEVAEALAELEGVLGDVQRERGA